MKTFKITGICSIIVGLIILCVSTYFGGDMFGYTPSTDPIIFRMQGLYFMTYVFGGFAIYCAYMCKSKKLAVAGFIQMLVIPCITSMIF